MAGPGSSKVIHSGAAISAFLSIFTVTMGRGSAPAIRRAGPDSWLSSFNFTVPWIPSEPWKWAGKPRSLRYLTEGKAQRPPRQLEPNASPASARDGRQRETDVSARRTSARDGRQRETDVSA